MNTERNKVFSESGLFFQVNLDYTRPTCTVVKEWELFLMNTENIEVLSKSGLLDYLHRLEPSVAMGTESMRFFKLDLEF